MREIIVNEPSFATRELNLYKQVGKKLTGIYCAEVPDDLPNKYKEKSFQSAYSYDIVLEFEDESIRVDYLFLIYPNDGAVPNDIKEQAFCGNEIWSDMIGKKLVSATYSFELQEYWKIFPKHKLELIFEGEAGITITDADHLDIEEACGIHRMYMGWKSKYIEKFFKLMIDHTITTEEGLKASEQLEGKKLSEKEAILKEYFEKNGYTIE